MERRKFVRSLGFSAAALYLGGRAASGGARSKEPIPENNAQELVFPSLPFAYDALEPYMDARTVEIHYDRHHRTYYNNLVNAIKGTPMESMAIADILKTASTKGDAIRNNGGAFLIISYSGTTLLKVPRDPQLI